LTVRISRVGDFIEVHSAKDDRVISVCRDKRFRWTGSVWRKEITSLNGTIEDRMAEICHALLLFGLDVVTDDNILQKAKTDNYLSEHQRWIKTNKDLPDKFLICWWGDDNYYEQARSLPGSRWDRERRSVTVPIKLYHAVMDFADIYDFRWTDKAKILLSEAVRIAEEEIYKGRRCNTSKAVSRLFTGEPARLKTPDHVEICEDLRDDVDV
jgi:hypothetical protein